MTIKVTSAELQKNFGAYQDQALVEPVTVSRYGRDSVVLISAAEYERLKSRDRQALALEELSDADIAAIERSRVPGRHRHLDKELG